MRIDRFLHYIRLVKSRTLAQSVIESGYVRIDGKRVGKSSDEVRAGSVVVFSSLTPHATKLNTTDAVRKAYIMQYIPDGAVVLRGNGASGPPVQRDLLGDDERAFWVVRDGERVEPPALARAV